jgi:hypothetical protein
MAVAVRSIIITGGCATRRHLDKAGFDVCERCIGVLRVGNAAVETVAAEAQPQVRRRQCRAVSQNRGVLRLTERLLQLAPQMPLKEGTMQGALGIIAKLLIFVVSIADQVADGREVVQRG